jgi:prepilin-type processing-associated H-X9-DG protein
LGLALDTYHDNFNCYPAAAVWRPGPLGSLALHTTRRIDIVTYDNWALSLLPYLNQQSLATRWRQDLPIAAIENTSVRETSVPQFTCPADSYHRADNPYRLDLETTPAEFVQFARGNYGYNAGPESGSDGPGSPASPGDYPPLIEVDQERGLFRDFGSGLGGINYCMSRDDFINGAGTMVALEELRAGIDPGDPRGVWAFGQIGGSITRGHGVAGDDCGPNNQWHRADDIRGCGELRRRLGQETLDKSRMPCVYYLDSNTQSTSRSLHLGGVNVQFLDGHVRFISDQIDPGVWHVLHHCDTPSKVVAQPIAQLLSERHQLEATPRPAIASTETDSPTPWKNTIGMTFVRIHSGTFEMGVADLGFGPPPPECPAHRVTITQPFWLGETEVTQQQYLQVMGFNPSLNTPETAGVDSTAEFPVENITWLEAKEFCEKLSALPEESLAHRQYRLPTEAEWEYACREGTNRPHSLPNKEQTELTGETAGASTYIPIGRVRRFPPNSLGIYDLRGNVWEWCEDWFERGYYARSTNRDPQGPKSGFLKLARGSDWIFVNMACMNNAQVYVPWKGNPIIGFRVICDQGEASRSPQDRSSQLDDKRMLHH